MTNQLPAPAEPECIGDAVVSATLSLNYCLTRMLRAFNAWVDHPSHPPHTTTTTTTSQSPRLSDRQHVCSVACWPIEWPTLTEWPGSLEPASGATFGRRSDPLRSSLIFFECVFLSLTGLRKLNSKISLIVCPKTYSIWTPPFSLCPHRQKLIHSITTILREFLNSLQLKYIRHKKCVVEYMFTLCKQTYRPMSGL
jgi:hypothetical protein